MAVATITATKIDKWNTATTLGTATSVSTDGGYLEWDDSDDKLVLMLAAAAQATVTAKIWVLNRTRHTGRTLNFLFRPSTGPCL